MKELIQDKVEKGINFEQYKNLVEHLLGENKTTGANQSEAYIKHTKMGLQRLKKWEKIGKLSDETKTKLEDLNGDYTWLVLVEAWCGDVGQNLSTISKMANHAGINLRLVFRDENLDLMDEFLTNGGRSIPKLIVVNNENLETLGEWGPRPNHAQEIITEAKKEPDYSYDKVQEVVHLWYAKNKQEDLQNEIVELMTAVDRELSSLVQNN